MTALEKAPGRIHRDIRIVAVNLHAQASGGVGHQDADGAQADNAQLLALDLRADKSALALFHGLADRVPLALQAPEPRPYPG